MVRSGEFLADMLETVFHCWLVIPFPIDVHKSLKWFTQHTCSLLRLCSHAHVPSFAHIPLSFLHIFSSSLSFERVNLQCGGTMSPWKQHFMYGESVEYKKKREKIT